MRSETGIIKTFCDGFYLEIYPIKNNMKRYWTAKISDKRKKRIKEFFDSSRGFVKFKAIEWIKNKKQEKRN